MKRHAPLPDLEEAERIVNQGRQIVKEHIPDAAAHDHADGCVKDQVIDLSEGHRRAGALAAHARQQPGGNEPEQIHQPVPAHAQRAEAESYGIKAGKFKHEDFDCRKTLV